MRVSLELPQSTKEQQNQRSRLLPLLISPWLLLALMYYPGVLPISVTATLYILVCVFQGYGFYRCGQLRDHRVGILGVFFFLVWALSKYFEWLLFAHPFLPLLLVSNLATTVRVAGVFWYIAMLIPVFVYNAAFWLGWLLGPKKGAAPTPAPESPPENTTLPDSLMTNDNRPTSENKK